MQNDLLDGLAPSLRDAVSELARSSGTQQVRELAASVDLANKLSGASDLQFAAQQLRDLSYIPDFSNALSETLGAGSAQHYLKDLAVNQQLAQVVSEMRSLQPGLHWDVASIAKQEADRLQQSLCTLSPTPAIDTMAATTGFNADEIVRNFAALSVADRFQDALGRLDIQGDSIRSLVDGLPGYADFLTRYEPVFTGYAGVIDYTQGLQADFAKVMAEASAWESLRSAADELLTTLGADAGMEAARSYFNDSQSLYREGFGQIVGSVASAMRYTRFEHDDHYEAHSVVSAADDGEGTSTRELSEDEVHVTVIFATALFEVRCRLVSLAQRIDPLVDAATPPDRLILCVASGHPKHAAALTGLGYPLLLQMNWASAPSGETAKGTPEALTVEDADQFDELAREMVDVLKAIERER